jgi:hypothetical protein
MPSKDANLLLADLFLFELPHSLFELPAGPLCNRSGRSRFVLFLPMGQLFLRLIAE